MVGIIVLLQIQGRGMLSGMAAVSATDDSRSGVHNADILIG